MSMEKPECLMTGLVNSASETRWFQCRGGYTLSVSSQVEVSDLHTRALYIMDTYEHHEAKHKMVSLQEYSQKEHTTR